MQRGLGLSREGVRQVCGVPMSKRIQFDYRDLTVIVTGATSGIGAATAVRMVKASMLIAFLAGLVTGC